MRLEAIGTIHSPFREAAGTPIQSTLAAGVEGSVELFEPFVPGLKDLEGFERVWLIYWLDRAPPARLLVTPFLDTAEHGIFATRSPCRPNPLGISCVRLLGIEGGRLRIADLDVLDGTPLLDLKPYAPRFDHFEVSRSGWLDEARVERTVADGRFAR